MNVLLNSSYTQAYGLVRNKNSWGGGGGWVGLGEVGGLGGGGVVTFLLLRVDSIVLSRRCAHVHVTS